MGVAIEDQLGPADLLEPIVASEPRGIAERLIARPALPLVTNPTTPLPACRHTAWSTNSSNRWVSALAPSGGSVSAFWMISSSRAVCCFWLVVPLGLVFVLVIVSVLGVELEVLVVAGLDVRRVLDALSPLDDRECVVGDLAQIRVQVPVDVTR